MRIIAATNRRLIDRVATNEFREDLFYRLNVIHIEIPPLRERREDIRLLIDHFIQTFSELYRVSRPALSPEALAQLESAPWPGNVRQLRNVLERIVVRAKREVITPADLPREVLSMSAQRPRKGCCRCTTRSTWRLDGWCATARRSGRRCTSRSCRAI